MWDASTGKRLRTIKLHEPLHSLVWGRDWLREAKCVAMAMGRHPRLGAQSPVCVLDSELLRMILDLF